MIEECLFGNKVRGAGRRQERGEGGGEGEEQ